MKKNIAILGVNNTIGIKAVDFFKNNSNKYNLYALSYDDSSENLDLFVSQIKELSPKRVFVENKKDADYILSKIKDLDIYIGSDNFPSFVSSSEIDEVVSALTGISSVKKILSSVYEFKDITLLNTSPLLYCGRIIINEVKSKGVNLNIFSYPVYSLDFINKAKNKSSILEIQLFSKKSEKEKISISDFKTRTDFIKKYYSINKIRLVNDMYLLHYIYNFSQNQFTFINQTEKIVNTNIKFSNGTNIIFAATLNINSIFNYYFLDKEHILDKDIISEKEITVSFSKIKTSSEKFLDLGLYALNKGGSSPIIYFITIETLLNKIYSSEIKENIDIYKITKDLIEDKSLYDKFPDLSSVYAIEQLILKKIENYKSS